MAITGQRVEGGKCQRTRLVTARSIGFPRPTLYRLPPTFEAPSLPPCHTAQLAFAQARELEAPTHPDRMATSAKQNWHLRSKCRRRAKGAQSHRPHQDRPHRILLPNYSQHLVPPHAPNHCDNSIFLLAPLSLRCLRSPVTSHSRIGGAHFEVIECPPNPHEHDPPTHPPHINANERP